MKLFYLLVSAFSIWTPTHSQFFYSHYTPVTQISPFFPQTFLPALPAPAPLAYTVPQNQAPSTSASVTYNIPSTPAAQFRGFGYRTELKDGASSTVFYVTGPEAENLRNFKDFPSFTRRVQEDSAGRARSLASDITDINAVPDAEGKIQSILQPAEFQKLFDTITPGIVNFYTFPASTVPLPLARQLNSTENVTTTTPPSEENEAAESVVNPKIITNDIDNAIKSNETTDSTTISGVSEATSTTTTSATTTTTESKKEILTSTTESHSASSTESSSPVSETKEDITSNNEEATTVETTTVV